jgi:hypothetical protein
MTIPRLIALGFLSFVIGGSILATGMEIGSRQTEAKYLAPRVIYPVPTADVFKSFGRRECIERGRAAYQQCVASATRKAG